MRYRQTTSRSGAVLVLLLVAIITLFAFVALAIDLGMLAVARTQLQDAVDVAAMAGGAHAQRRRGFQQQLQLGRAERDRRRDLELGALQTD